MAGLLEARASRHVLAVFDALPLIGLEADTAAMNLALTSFDIDEATRGSSGSKRRPPQHWKEDGGAGVAWGSALRSGGRASSSAHAHQASAEQSGGVRGEPGPPLASLLGPRGGGRGKASSERSAGTSRQAVAGGPEGSPGSSRFSQGADLPGDTIAALMRSCLTSDDPAAVLALLRVLPRMERSLQPTPALATAHMQALLQSRAWRAAEAPAGVDGAAPGGQATAALRGRSFGASDAEIMAACELVALALPQAGDEAEDIRAALRVAVRVVARTEDPALAIRVAVLAQSANIAAPPEAQRSIVAICLSTGRLQTLVDDLLASRSHGHSGPGVEAASTMLLAACCLLPAKGVSIGLPGAELAPASAPGGASLPAALLLSSSTLRVLWTPQLMLELIQLLGSVGRWPEAAAAFWAALVVLAPRHGGPAPESDILDAEAEAAQASLLAMTDPSRLPPLLTVFSLCRSVFSLRRQLTSRQERVDTCNTLLKALLTDMRRAGVRAGASSLMETMLARRVSLHTTSSAMLLALGVHPRGPSALAMLRRTAPLSEHGHLDLLHLSGAVAGDPEQPGRPRETNALPDVPSLPPGSHTAAAVWHPLSPGTSNASTAQSAPTTLAVLRSGEHEVPPYKQPPPLLEFDSRARRAPLVEETRLPATAASAAGCDWWQSAGLTRRSAPQSTSGRAVGPQRASPLCPLAQTDCLPVPPGLLPEAAPAPMGALCPMRVHQSKWALPPATTAFSGNSVEREAWPQRQPHRSASVPAECVVSPVTPPPPVATGCEDSAVLTIRPAAARRWLQRRGGGPYLPTFRGQNSTEIAEFSF